MPAKYHIHTKTCPARFRLPGKLGIVDWREDCARCHNCVKHACVYGLYHEEADTLREELGYLDYIYQCKGCLSCVQNCSKGILTRVVNPEYKRLGDAYFTPDILLTTWYQSETGRIPVSGGGYGGPFCGPGFDSMWTDMSEIVRPTRDGIHGREYINTGVEIGRRPGHLSFTDGRPDGEAPPLIQTPLPVMFDVLPRRWNHPAVVRGATAAAARMGLLAVVEPASAGSADAPPDRLVALVADGVAPEAMSDYAMVMIPDGPDVERTRSALRERKPSRIVSVRLSASSGSKDRVLQLAGAGVESIHLVFDAHGREQGASPRHARDVLREVHGALVRAGLRDQVTLTASGGIALAEHVTKALICGADLVAIDVPLALALECRLCLECDRGQPCPVALAQIDADYAAGRIVNLMGAWHQQLIEMLGAMGIREVRRLRGEVGRCMFVEDLERDTFGRMFGRRKTGASGGAA